MISITELEKNELLKILESGVTLGADEKQELADLVEKMNKRKVIENHPYAISVIQIDGKPYYTTYVADDSKKDGRRKISAQKREHLENKIYEDYKQKTTLTFDMVCKEWLKAHKSEVKPQSFQRLMTDYNRFIPKCSFAKKPIKSIEALQVREYLQKTMIDEKLSEQAYKNLKTILRGTFAHAVEHKYILTNPMRALTVSTVNLAKPKKKAREEVVFTIKERDLLRNYITKDSENYTDTAPYAILLSFQLGLRVGELVALKWSDISKGTIHIQRQEVIYDVYDDDLNKTKSSVHEIVEYTKTQAGERILPLTPEAKRILDKIKEWNTTHKLKSDFIFVNASNHNLNRQRINTCLYSYCEKVDIIKKSSHKIRRSVISSLLDNLANKKAVQEFAGHENIETTFNSYYKNISDDDDLITGMCACL